MSSASPISPARIPLARRPPGRPPPHDRMGAGPARARGQARRFLRGLFVRVQERHVEPAPAATLQDRLVHVHRNAPARNAARATIIAYFVTRWERAGFAAEWRAA